MLSEYRGKALTVRGPVEPSALGRVMMHEHLHSDCYDWEKEELIVEEHPITEERRALLLREAIPYMKQRPDYGCFSYVDVTPAPWRAWPTMYVEAAELAGLHIILATGGHGPLFRTPLEIAILNKVVSGIANRWRKRAQQDRDYKVTQKKPWNYSHSKGLSLLFPLIQA
jgi:predicted metal-dependent phosphotriesterase family hydrolase